MNNLATAAKMPNDNMSSSPAHRLAEAVERIGAIAEGREILAFLKDQNISLRACAMEDKGGIDWFGEEITVSDQLNAADMASVIVHEAYHGMQLANSPALTAAVALFVKGFGLPPGQSVEVLRPRDLLWVFNAMEMGAYAVQTDFAVQLADRAGDDGLLHSVHTPVGALSRLYRVVSQAENDFALRLKDKILLNIYSAEEQAMHKAFNRDYAAAAVAHHWFWSGQQTDTQGRQLNLHYNDHLMTRVAYGMKAGAAPVFHAAAGDARFVAWGHQDIARMGRGYAINPLDVPGAARADGPAYRSLATRENTAIMRRAEWALGLR